MKRAILAAMALGFLQACDVPSGPVAEPLNGAQLEARLSDHKLTLWRAGTRKQVIISLRANGTGTAAFLPGSDRREIKWDIRAAQLCIAYPQDALECARPAISGNNITVRFTSRTNRFGQFSGTISPI